VLAGLLVGGGAAWRAAAQDDPPRPTPVSDQARRQALEAAILRDRQGPQNLQPLARIDCVNGFAGPYPCSNIDLLAFMPLSQIGASDEGNDLWGWTDPQTGKEYALMGLTNGTAFVDISDPENPLYLGILPPRTTDSIWRDIKVYADHAFIVSEAAAYGMQIFDLTQLRSVTTPPITFTQTAYYTGFGPAHNIAINQDTGFAYVVGANTCSGGLTMIDLQNPTAPASAGCYSDDGYIHDVQCVLFQGPDVQYQGREICFAANEDALTIVDVTNKSAPELISKTTYPDVGYTHQGWLTPDQAYFLLGDELDEDFFGTNTRTRVFDLSDLSNPVLVETFTGPTQAIDHNVYTVGNLAYESNYTAGLRVVSIVDPANLIEVGFFDVYPAHDNATFNGTWSNYPFFDSGVVIVSGIEQGLFILQPNLLATLQGNVVLEGRGDHSGVSVTILQSGTPVSSTVTTAGGGFSFVLPLGTYQVQIEAARYLDAQTVVTITTPGEVTLPGVTLLGGDSNDDDRVDILDLALQGGRFGLNNGDPGWVPAADINADGTVDDLDLSISRGNFGRTSPLPWP